jgi:hypothetical protein
MNGLRGREQEMDVCVAKETTGIIKISETRPFVLFMVLSLSIDLQAYLELSREASSDKLQVKYRY